MKTTTTHWEIKSGAGLFYDSNGNYRFNSVEHAERVITEFKNNPRSHNPSMTEENVQDWKHRTYTIVCKTVIIEEIKTI
jgi:viroplasmin and RNaseH domain-containing protein